MCYKEYNHKLSSLQGNSSFTFAVRGTVKKPSLSDFTIIQTSPILHILDEVGNKEIDQFNAMYFLNASLFHDVTRYFTPFVFVHKHANMCFNKYTKSELSLLLYLLEL